MPVLSLDEIPETMPLQVVQTAEPGAPPAPPPAPAPTPAPAGAANV
jgi:hypothetical protein